MKKLIDYPSYSNVVSVLEECPSSIFIYLLLWKNRIGYRTIAIKEFIEEKYFIHEDIFLEHLFALQATNVLFFDERKSAFVITHQNAEVNAEGYMLC
jgi:hypothetical protein